MKSVIKFIALFIISTCTSCKNVFLPEETIVVTYFQGFREFERKVIPPIFEDVIPSPMDTMYITKEEYVKIKEYAYSQEAQEHSKNIDARLSLSIDTVMVYFGVFDHYYNPSDRIQSMEYLVKSNSNYYNYFTIDELNSFYCREIQKYGIPQNYHYIDRSKNLVKKEYYSFLLKVK